MTNLTNRLLRKAAKLAEESQIVHGELTNAFIERYGITYSDVDADSIIDTLDYFGGSLTVAECDDIMAATGHPPKGYEEEE